MHPNDLSVRSSQTELISSGLSSYTLRSMFKEHWQIFGDYELIHRLADEIHDWSADYARKCWIDEFKTPSFASYQYSLPDCVHNIGKIQFCPRVHP
ncbi:Uncharacterised protein [uncultured archaeon]|nr:Uncharacterised protein [uncultured archaeon]